MNTASTAKAKRGTPPGRGGVLGVWRVALIVLPIGAAAVFAAQGASPSLPPPTIGLARPSSSDPTPVFKSGTTVVQIDAAVTDAAGRPVTGLTKDDFEVREARQIRRVSTFAEVSIPIHSPIGLPEKDAPEPDVATNVRPQGRTFLFALDEVGPDRALRTRHLLHQFLAEHFGPNDLAAVALTGRGLADSGQDFTDNRRLLLQAIDKFSGGFGGSESQCPQSSSVRQLAESLRRLTEFLATLPGRKVLVYVGEGLSGLDVNAVRAYSGGVLTVADTDAHAALGAATRGNVTIYPVDPCGLTTALGIGNLENRMDLRMLAEATGGFAVTNTNNFTDAFARLIEENSHYYTLGFESGYTRRDGRFVPVEVRVKRDGLQVKTRPGYMAPMTESPRPDRPPTSPGLATRVTGEARLPAVADALASAVAVSGIPLRLFVAPYRGTRDRATVAVAVEIDVSPLRLVAKNGTVTVPIEVTYVATDSRGKVLPGHRHATTLGIKESAVDRVRTDGVRVLSEFSLAPGRYQIRVAAGSAATAGSVLADLEIPEFGKGPLAMSGIFLSSDRAATVTTLTPIAPLGGALPWSPSARRDFGREETLGLFVEVYENAPTETRPHAIAWTASLRGESGTALPLATERRATSTSGTPPPYRFTARVPLVSVAPGSYVLEVEARSDLEDNVAVTRRLPIHVR